MPVYHIPRNVTFSETKTYSIQGEIIIESGQDGVLPSFIINLGSGETAKIKDLSAFIESGTNAVVKLQKNGSDITGYTSLSVTTTAGDLGSGEVTLADGDKIKPVVTSVSGTPKNLSLNVNIEHESPFRG